jgi:hypothetical protein
MSKIPTNLEKNGQHLLSKNAMEKKKLELGQMVGSGSGRNKVLRHRRQISTDWWLQLVLYLSTLYWLEPPASTK